MVRPHVYAYASQDEEAQGRVHNADILGFTSEGRTLYLGSDGQIMLADQSGQLFISADSAKNFSLMGQAPFGGITDIIQSQSGYAVATARGSHPVSDDNLVSRGAR